MFNYNVITPSCIGGENLTELSEKPQPARNHWQTLSHKLYDIDENRMFYFSCDRTDYN